MTYNIWPKISLVQYNFLSNERINLCLCALIAFLTGQTNAGSHAAAASAPPNAGWHARCRKAWWKYAADDGWSGREAWLTPQLRGPGDRPEDPGGGSEAKQSAARSTQASNGADELGRPQPDEQHGQQCWAQPGHAATATTNADAEQLAAAATAEVPRPADDAAPEDARPRWDGAWGGWSASWGSWATWSGWAVKTAVQAVC